MFVQWDFDTKSVIQGPQSKATSGDNWFPLVRAALDHVSDADELGYVFDDDTQTVHVEVVGIIPRDYSQRRSTDYGEIAEQLDMLWHDIHNNTLDQSGRFYTFIKSVKDTHVKA